MVLALDASTGVTTVAVARSETRKLLASISVPSPRPSGGASEALLPAVHAALGLAGEELSPEGLILCGLGPGTFTGIRIAAATARALALGTGASLAAGSTLDALAAPARSCHPDVLAVIDARRGEVFARRYAAGGPATEILCVEPEGLVAGGSPLVVGDGAVRYRERLERIGHVPPDTSPLHRVSAEGHVISADLTPIAADALVPIYVREPDAEVRRDLNPWGLP